MVHIIKNFEFYLYKHGNSFKEELKHFNNSYIENVLQEFSSDIYLDPKLILLAYYITEKGYRIEINRYKTIRNKYNVNECSLLRYCQFVMNKDKFIDII